MYIKGLYTCMKCKQSHKKETIILIIRIAKEDLQQCTKINYKFQCTSKDCIIEWKHELNHIKNGIHHKQKIYIHKRNVKWVVKVFSEDNCCIKCESLNISSSYLDIKMIINLYIISNI